MHGTIEAADEDAARAELQNQELSPDELFQISYDSSSSAPPPAPAEADITVESEKDKEIEIEEPDTQASPYDWENVEKEATVKARTSEERIYYPIVDTLRLYAGWLLAWYFLVYALGLYQTTRELPFRIPYLQGIFDSPLVLSFTLASFLFLLMTSLNRLVDSNRKFLSGLVFTVLGLAAFVLYRMNT